MGLFDKSLKEIGNSIVAGASSLLDTSPRQAFNATKNTVIAAVEKTAEAYGQAKVKAQARKIKSIASFLGVEDPEVQIKYDKATGDVKILLRNKKKEEANAEIEDAKIIEETTNG